MYKMAILDLDGTLVNTNKEITKFTFDTIMELSTKVKFVIASARSFFSVKPYVEQLGLLNEDNYTIAFNGSLIVNNSSEEALVDEEIDLDKKNLLQGYVNEHLDIKWRYYTYDKRILLVDIDNIQKFIETNKIYKVVCETNEKDIISLRNSMPQKIMDSFQVTSSEINRIEFVKKGMKKTEGIALLMEKLNIDASELIAMGNGENDIEMIKFAACGVAMGNAPEIVKAAADFITDTNDNDGVGKALRKLIK